MMLAMRALFLMNATLYSLCMSEPKWESIGKGVLVTKQKSDSSRCDTEYDRLGQHSKLDKFIQHYDSTSD